MHMEKYMIYEKLKITSISRICQTIHHNGSYLLLFRNRKILNFEILCE